MSIVNRRKVRWCFLGARHFGSKVVQNVCNRLCIPLSCDCTMIALLGLLADDRTGETILKARLVAFPVAKNCFYFLKQIKNSQAQKFTPRNASLFVYTLHCKYCREFVFGFSEYPFLLFGRKIDSRCNTNRIEGFSRRLASCYSNLLNLRLLFPITHRVP